MCERGIIQRTRRCSRAEKNRAGRRRERERERGSSEGNYEGVEAPAVLLGEGIDWTRAVNLVIEGSFCYRFNRITLSNRSKIRRNCDARRSASRNFTLAERRTGWRRVASPLPGVEHSGSLSFDARRGVRCSPTTLSCYCCYYCAHHHTGHRPPQTIFTRGHHLAPCEIHLGECSSRRCISPTRVVSKARRRPQPSRIHRIKS